MKTLSFVIPSTHIYVLCMAVRHSKVDKGFLHMDRSMPLLRRKYTQLSLSSSSSISVCVFGGGGDVLDLQRPEERAQIKAGKRNEKIMLSLYFLSLSLVSFLRRRIYPTGELDEWSNSASF